MPTTFTLVTFQLYLCHSITHCVSLLIIYPLRSLDEWINDWVFEMLEMYADGRAGLDLEETDYGFKTRDQIEKEKEREQEKGIKA
jgi:hypothetical protein